MRIGIIDQLELFGAGCCRSGDLPLWTAPSAQQVLRERIQRDTDRYVIRRERWSRPEEDPERWDGLA